MTIAYPVFWYKPADFLISSHYLLANVKLFHGVGGWGMAVISDSGFQQLSLQFLLKFIKIPNHNQMHFSNVGLSNEWIYLGQHLPELLAGGATACPVLCLDQSCSQNKWKAPVRACKAWHVDETSNMPQRCGFLGKRCWFPLHIVFPVS